MGYAPSTQVIGALGRTFLQLHEALEKSKGKLERSRWRKSDMPTSNRTA
jgi:hypothetical protein